MTNKIFQSSFLILFFTSINYILNYAYTLVAIHFLTPLQYSELAFLIAIYSLFGIFGATITNISLPLLHEKENAKIKLEVIAVTKILSIVLLLLSVTIFPFIISRFFNINSYVNIILFSVGGVSTLSVALLTVHLQVVKNFFRVGLIQTFSTFIKFIISFILLYFGYNIFGVGISLLLSSLLALILFFPWTKENLHILLKQIKGKTSTSQTMTHVKDFYNSHKSLILKSFVGSFTLTLLMTLDTILAKKFLAEDVVGYFVGISTLAKLFLFGIMAISSVIFPYYLSEEDIVKKKNILKYFLSFTLIASIFWLLLSYFAHDYIVPTILGAKYLSYSIHLFSISLFVCMASFAYILTQLAILENNKNLLKNIFLFFIIFIISTFIFLKNLSPNINAINIKNFSEFLSLQYLILTLILYFKK